jgi:hypothetical protein
VHIKDVIPSQFHKEGIADCDAQFRAGLVGPDTRPVVGQGHRGDRSAWADPLEALPVSSNHHYGRFVSLAAVEAAVVPAVAAVRGDVARGPIVVDLREKVRNPLVARVRRLVPFDLRRYSSNSLS